MISEPKSNAKVAVGNVGESFKYLLLWIDFVIRSNDVIFSGGISLKVFYRDSWILQFRWMNLIHIKPGYIDKDNLILLELSVDHVVKQTDWYLTQ